MLNTDQIMKKTLLVILSVVAFGLQAQISITDAEVNVSGNHSDSDFYQNTYAVYSGEGELDVNWQREIVSTPEGWEFSNCFPSCFPKEKASGEVTMLGGEDTYLNTHFYPNGVAGTAQVKIIITLQDAPETSFEALFIGTATGLAIDENEVSQLLMYPNPTQNVISLKSNKEIHRVMIYNQLGGLVKNVSPNNTLLSIDINDLSKGVYFITTEYSTGETQQLRFVKS